MIMLTDICNSPVILFLELTNKVLLSESVCVFIAQLFCFFQYIIAVRYISPSPRLSQEPHAPAITVPLNKSFQNTPKATAPMGPSKKYHRDIFALPLSIMYVSTINCTYRKAISSISSGVTRFPQAECFRRFQVYPYKQAAKANPDQNVPAQCLQRQLRQTGQITASFYRRLLL